MIFDELFKEELPENKIKKIDAILNQLQLSFRQGT